MVISKKLEYVMYPIVKIKLATKCNNSYNYIINKYKSLIDKKNSLFRRNQTGLYNFGYSKDNSKNIISYTFKKVKSIESMKANDIITKTIKNPNKIKFFIANNGFIICASHLLHDGISLMNTILHLEENRNSLLKLPTFYYIPFFNEIKTFFYIIMSLLKGLPKKYLKLDYPPRQSHTCNIIRSKISLNLIKKLKNKISVWNKSTINFSSVFSLIQAMSIFYSSNKEMVTIGIVVGLSNKNRFNNFTAIPITLNRPKLLKGNKINSIELKKFEFYKCYKELYIDFKNKFESNKFYVDLLYSLTNIYDFTLPINKTMIDILISGIPTNNNSQSKLNGIEISKFSGYNFYHSTPIYILYLSDQNNVFTTIHSRTNDVNIIKLKEFNNNIEKYLTQI